MIFELIRNSFHVVPSIETSRHMFNNDGVCLCNPKLKQKVFIHHILQKCKTRWVVIKHTKSQEI